MSGPSGIADIRTGGTRYPNSNACKGYLGNNARQRKCHICTEHTSRAHFYE